MSDFSNFHCVLCTAGSNCRVFPDVVKGDVESSFSIVCCSTCGHVQLFPPENDLAFYEEDGQTKNVIKHYGTPFEKLLEHSWIEARRRVERFDRYHIGLTQKGVAAGYKVLDVGGGYMFFASELASKWGFAEIVVLEPSEYRSKIGKDRLKEHGKIVPEFQNALLDEDFCKQHSGSYDLVTMWHVLEHVKDPVELLENAYHLLKPGGALCVEVPNLSDELMTRSDAFRARSFMVEHISYFSPHTLTLAASNAAAGAEVVVDGYQRYGILNYMNWVFQNAPQGENPDLFEGKDRIWVEEIWRKQRELNCTSDALFMTIRRIEK